ncbi:MAG TPA: hypothetical protein VFV54_11905 [Thermoanaerobaculia bacterium]|nr:hypothetical protein [Thermoanaerobaculia bacterium]
MDRNDATDAHGEENPPVGRTWPRLYAIVLGVLALEILIFYWFTKAFA